MTQVIPIDQIDLTNARLVRNQIIARGWTCLGLDDQVPQLILCTDSLPWTNGASPFERKYVAHGKRALELIQCAIRLGLHHLFPDHMDAKWYVVRNYVNRETTCARVAPMYRISLGEAYSIVRFSGIGTLKNRISRGFETEDEAVAEMKELIAFHATVLSVDLPILAQVARERSFRWFSEYYSSCLY